MLQLPVLLGGRLLVELGLVGRTLLQLAQHNGRLHAMLIHAEHTALCAFFVLLACITTAAAVTPALPLNAAATHPQS